MRDMNEIIERKKLQKLGQEEMQLIRGGKVKPSKPSGPKVMSEEDVQI